MIDINQDITDGYFDTYKIILNNFKEIRVLLTPEMLQKIKNELFKNYNSVLQFSIKNNLHTIKRLRFTPLNRWLRPENNAGIPTEVLIKLCKSLCLNQEEVLNSIVAFSKHTSPKTKITRFIKINEDLIYGLALYLGEGKNRDKAKKRTSFSNSEEEIIKFCIVWFKGYLGIDKEKLKFYTVCPLDADVLELKKEISNKYDIKEEQIYFSKKITNVVTIQLSFDSSVTRRLVDWLKINCIKLALNNKDFGIKFIQGIYDGEGSVRGLLKNREVSLVLEMKDQLAINTIRYLLKQEGVDTRRPNYNKDLIYTATRDYPKLKNIGTPFRYNTRNKKKFLEMGKRIKRLQTFNGGIFFEILQFMKKNKECSFGVDELNVLLKRKGKASNNFRKAMNRAISLGLINKNGKGTKWDRHEHTITEEGIKYFTKINLKRINHYNCLKAHIINEIDKNGNKYMGITS